MQPRRKKARRLANGVLLMFGGSLTTSGEVTILKVPQRERERSLAQPASSLVFIVAGERPDENCLLTLQYIGSRLVF